MTNRLMPYGSKLHSQLVTKVGGTNPAPSPAPTPTPGEGKTHRASAQEISTLRVLRHSAGGGGTGGMTSRAAALASTSLANPAT